MIEEKDLYEYCRKRITACRAAGQQEGVVAYNDVMDWIDAHRR